jgi:hypothetical protein
MFPADVLGKTRCGAASAVVGDDLEQGNRFAGQWYQLLDARVRTPRANAECIAVGKPPPPKASRLPAAMEHGLPSLRRCPRQYRIYNAKADGALQLLYQRLRG